MKRQSPTTPRIVSARANSVEIDAINIHRASLEAMRRAVMTLAPLPDLVLVDAFRIPELLMAQRGVLHGDRRCTAIAAASIVAKVTRDREMLVHHAEDPRYGYDRHKGYATADHLAAVARVADRVDVEDLGEVPERAERPAGVRADPRCRAGRRDGRVQLNPTDHDAASSRGEGGPF